MPLRIVFMGTAELACASLKALLDSLHFEILGVVTQPDRPKGRDLKLQPSPVKTIAAGAGLPVWQPGRARHPDFLAALAALRPDMLVVAAYGQILPQAMLDLPRFGGVNVHASLLPKYRGAAPIQWAILNGEAETGVTIMKMAAGLDTGDILSRRAVPIFPEDNAATLHERLAVLGAELLVPTILDTRAAASSLSRRSNQRPATPEKLRRKMAAWIGRSRRERYGTGCAPSLRGRAPLPACPKNPRDGC